MKPRTLEHELFRAAMQIVVGIRQGHPQNVLLQCADHLEKMAVKHAYSLSMINPTNADIG